SVLPKIFTEHNESSFCRSYMYYTYNSLYEQMSLFKRQCKDKNIKELSLAALWSDIAIGILFYVVGLWMPRARKSRVF
ncbi:hypothetical protein, partial [Bartonella sp. AP57NXGY]|uniref:hypothetical protein n=1 Tax=Bartonella sp. AP57NXGY TaxID=3243497 RepID=UPI0035D04941